MKLNINGCHIYLLVILLCVVSWGTVVKIAQVVLIAWSLYYAFYANIKYKLPVYFKALNVLLIMFTIYGFLLIISGETLMVTQRQWREVANTGYLKSIYKSLLPIYAFYVFARRELLTEKTMKFWFFIFLVLTVRLFNRAEAAMLQKALEAGSSAEEFTNNVAYTFVGLLPALVLFYKKPIIQYLCLVFCAYFIIVGMKRGAILTGGICLIWFITTNVKKVPRNRRWIVILVSVVVVAVGFYFFRYMMETSSYFQYRIEQTREGNSSGRDGLYATFFQHFINEPNPFRFLFGNGAYSTLKFSDNLAHNDWLEIAIGQGLLGIVIYLVYWICFYVNWRRSKNHPQAFMAIGMLLIIYFLSTLFSMSYNSVSRCSAMVLGYYLAMYNENDTMVLVEDQPECNQP